jgi:hypothetical protein
MASVHQKHPLPKVAIFILGGMGVCTVSGSLLSALLLLQAINRPAIASEAANINSDFVIFFWLIDTINNS